MTYDVIYTSSNCDQTCYLIINCSNSLRFMFKAVRTFFERIFPNFPCQNTLKRLITFLKRQCKNFLLLIRT